MKTLKKVHAGSPLITNAHMNRCAAEKAFKAGVTMQQIAEYWPEVWQLKMENGKQVIGQRYDYELADGSGRYETRRTITEESVAACIKKYRGE